MASNEIDFTTYHADAAATATVQIILDQVPFGQSVAAGRSMSAEVTFTSSGSVDGYLSIEKWLFAWRYSGADTCSEAAVDLREVRLGYAGSSPMTSAIANVSSGVPSIDFVPGAPVRNWTVRGTYWVESAA